MIEGLRANLETIKDDSIRSFIQDAIKCYEGELYRPAILMSWMAAIYILYKHVHNKCLKEFNEEAKSKDGKWKAAKEIDDLGRMKEVVFLDRLEALAVIDRTRKNQLGICLKLRNICSHPSSLEISSTIADAHFEMLLHNVFSESRFTDDIVQPPETIGIELIQRRVGAFFGVRVGDLKSSKKQKSISMPRQVAMFLCREHTRCSFSRDCKKIRRKGSFYSCSCGEKHRKENQGGSVHFQRRVRNFPGAEKKLGSTASKPDSTVSWQLNFND